jgi:hypothetical protein
MRATFRISVFRISSFELAVGMTEHLTAKAPLGYRRSTQYRGDAMSHKLLTRVSIITFASAALVLTAHAEDTKGKKHVFRPPVDITQALKIEMETKATEDLLKRVAEQCVDADCKKQVEECRKTLPTCVIVPSKASVREQEMENN